MVQRQSAPGRQSLWRRFLPGLVIAVGTAISIHPDADTANIDSRPPSRLFAGDSVVVDGPERFYGEGSSVWAIYSASFTPDSLLGWRYYTRVVSQGISKVILSVNGQEYIGQNEGGSNTRMVDVTPGSNSVDVMVKGTTTSYIDVYITRTRESMFKVFDATYTRPGTISHQDTIFTVPDAARSPFRLWMINGGLTGLNRITNATLTLNSTTVLSGSDFSANKAAITRLVTLLPSDTLDLYNQGAAGSFARFRLFATDSTPPAISVTYPTPSDTLTTLSSVTVAGSVTDSIFGLLTVNDQTRKLTPGAFTDAVSLPADKRYVIPIFALNAAKGATLVQRLMIRDTRAPTLEVEYPEDGLSTTAESLNVSGRWRDSVLDNGHGRWGERCRAERFESLRLSIPVGPRAQSDLRRAVDALGHRTEVTRFVLRHESNEPSPPAPLNPSELSNTGITGFKDQVRFLFTGSSPPQSGVVDSIVSLDRAAVVRGRAVARDLGPLANVQVRVLGHPEYGSTLTRSDGFFDLAVNGGGQLTLRLTRAGYLEAQRQVEPLVNSYYTMDEVAMIGRSARFAVVDLESAQLVRSRFATDANGDREVRLYFPGTMRARIENSITPADSEFRHVRVRATEYTMGAQGLAAMPAQLPPSSAYTYCVELSLDEGDSLSNAAGSPKAVRFTKPVSCYVRNFLSYAVGTRVPLGYFDRASGRWVAEDDAVVLKIVGTSGDTALVDSDGDGMADAPALLTSLGISDEERRLLLAEYGENGVLWRARLAHFSPGDMNPNAGPPPDPLPTGPRRLFQLFALLFGPCISEGSIIECENRVLGERIPVVGTPYTINYRSFRAPGDAAVRTVRVPIIGDTIPSTLDSVYVVMEAAGKVYREAFARSEISGGQIVSLGWDGLDIYGRRVEGSINARVSVGYRYSASARGGSTGRGAFGNPAKSGVGVLAVNADRNVPRVNWTRRTIALGVPGTGTDGLGGWTLSPHHVFDPNGRGAVYYGSGEIDSGDRIPMARWTFGAYQQSPCPSIDNQPLSAVTVRPSTIALGPDGSLYFADGCRGSVYRVGKNGIIQRIAGAGSPGGINPAAFGGPATSATLGAIEHLTVVSDGTVYLGGKWNPPSAPYGVISKVSTDGTLHRIIGDGLSHAFGTGDDGPVSSATTTEVAAIAVGPDGALYSRRTARRPPLVAGTPGCDGSVRTVSSRPMRAAIGVEVRATP